MIAEFYGLPGSGKSTQVNLMKEKFPEKIELIVFSKKLFRKRNIRNIFSLEFIGFFFKLLRLWIVKITTMKTELFNKKSFRDEFKTAFYFASLYLEFMYLREHDSDETLYILDHGLIQCLSSLVWDKKNVCEKSDSIINYIAEHFSQSVDYVYIAGCGAEETYKRIMGRKWVIRLHSYSRDDGIGILNNIENLFNKAQSVFKEKGRLLFIDNSSGINEQHKKLCDYYNLQVSE